MRGISTFNLLLKRSLFGFSLFLTQQAVAQVENVCSVIQADFNVTDNGFTSTSTPYYFTYTLVSNGDGHFEASIPRNVADDQALLLISPTYSNPSQSGVVYYGFTLSGYARGITYEVKVYSGNTLLGESGILPVTTNPNANNQNTRVCDKILDSDFTFGSAIRYEITIYSPNPRGNGNVDVIIEFDDFSLGSVDAIILPVDIKSLTAKKATRGTQIAWSVANELNVSRYEVLKGSNAGDLKTIGIVFAGEKSSYTFVDEQPSQGVSFYRIRSIDIDGKYKFSTVISFANGKSAALLRAYPMPARNQVTLQHGTIEGKAQITISSEDGRIVKRQVPATGSMLTPIDLSGLKAGLYLLRLEYSNGEVETLKLVKQ